MLPSCNSYIDLILTNQPNLVVKYGTHSSLNSQCHHHITYCKLNLNIEYPLGLRKNKYRKYQKSIDIVNWETLLPNNTLKKQISIFSEIIMNIFSSFVPSKLVTFDVSDFPCMNELIKNKIKWKHQI